MRCAAGMFDGGVNRFIFSWKSQSIGQNVKSKGCVDVGIVIEGKIRSVVSK